MALTKSQINKLGDELRHLDALDSIPEPLLVRLQEFRSLYDAPLVEAQTLVKDRLGLDTTSRLKTVNTIVEKLRREKTRLAEMQDIAGLRIVVSGGLFEQDSHSNRGNDTGQGGQPRSRKRFALNLLPSSKELRI